MKKNRKRYKRKKTLKINEKNDIDSIIEVFQKFGKKYNIITTTLDSNIQYQTKETKITQTYTTTLLEKSIGSITRQLEKQGKITLIIIDNMDCKNREVEEKIDRINKIHNVKTRTIKEEDTFKALDDILSGSVK